VEAEWDEGKARENERKHGVVFLQAASAFDDELAITRRYDRAGEERFTLIGMDDLGRVLFVVYTWRGNRLRVISARLATSAEMRRYREAE
jgi:hypothetical protein